MTCGIYCITNLINGKQYVGQSVDIEKRMNDHIHSDSNSKIHQAIMEYGVKNFRFEPLIRCSPEELDEQEVKFIRLLGTYENGYNQTRGGQHHVFNIEYNYETYSELKMKIQEKNDVIYDIKQKNKELSTEIRDLNQTIKNLKEWISKDKELLNSKKVAETNSKDMEKYKVKIMELQNENETLSEEKQFLQSENGYLRKIVDSSHEELTKEIEELSKEKDKFKRNGRKLKKDIRELNIAISEMEKDVAQKNRQIQILHERLGWQPKKNIFDEVLEEKRSAELEGK